MSNDVFWRNRIGEVTIRCEDISFRIRLCPALGGLVACMPMLKKTLLRHHGVVESIAAPAPAVTRSGGSAGGGTKLDAGVNGMQTLGGSFAPTVGYRVGSGDNLRFNIFSETGMSDFPAGVDNAGYVRPSIGKVVRVGGKTTRAIQGEIKKASVPHFTNPWVKVELVATDSVPLYFLGESREPSMRDMKGATDVLDATALAGGLGKDVYLPRARLLRDVRVCTVDLNVLLRNEAYEQNVWMKPEDVPFAPLKEGMLVHALGAVTCQQSVTFGSKGRTLLQVLSMAGGAAKRDPHHTHRLAKARRADRNGCHADVVRAWSGFPDGAGQRGLCAAHGLGRLERGDWRDPVQPAGDRWSRDVADADRNPRLKLNSRKSGQNAAFSTV
jgi:polysaccharide export outer membrane protein